MVRMDPRRNGMGKWIGVLALAFVCHFAIAEICSETLNGETPATWSRRSRFAKDPAKILNELAQQKLDVAVEAEMPFDPLLMKHITTSTETVEGIFKDRTSPVPIETPWSLINVEARRHLILSANKGAHFFLNRKIYGLQMRQGVYDMKFWRAEGESFLGRWYPPGVHSIDLSRFLLNDVEFGSPKSVENLELFEIHFRALQSAGRMAQDVWTFQRGLGLIKTGLHVHIPFSLPRSSLYNNAKVYEIADFYRRTNLVAEMTVVMEDELPIPQIIREESVVHYQSLTCYDLFMFVDNLLDYKRGEPFDSSRFLASVAWRWPGTYSDPRLMGFELRTLTPKTPPRIAGPLLDTIHAYLINVRKRPVSKKFKEWFEWFKTQGPPRRLTYRFSHLWYNHASPWSSFGPPELQPLIETYRKLDQHRETAENVTELLLLHDWTNDPVLFAQPEFQKNVLAAQKRTLEFLIENPDHSKIPVIRTFLKESGLYSAFSQSLGDW